ncbi:hypothetical protein ACWGRV_30205 [Streptomyces sp. NPDC055663]
MTTTPTSEPGSTARSRGWARAGSPSPPPRPTGRDLRPVHRAARLNALHAVAAR